MNLSVRSPQQSHKVTWQGLIFSPLGKMLLACTLVVVWIVVREQIGQMDSRWFQPSVAGLEALGRYVFSDYDGAARAYRAHLREAVEQGGTSGDPGVDALLRGDGEGARTWAQQALDRDPKDLSAQLTLAELAITNQEPQRALARLAAVLAQDADNFDAHLLLAVAQTQSSAYGDAIDSFKRAFRTNTVESRVTGFLLALESTGNLAERPVHERPLCLLAHYYRYLRIYDSANGRRAVASATQAIAAGDRPDDGYLTLGVVQYKQGDREAALAAFLNAIRVNPKNAEAYRWAATVYADRGQDLLNEYRAWQSAWEAAPEDPFYYDAFLRFLSQRLGDYPRAVRVALEGLDRWPGRPEFLREMILMSYQLGQYEPAMAYARQLLAAQPQNAEGYTVIGYSLLQLQRVEEATAIFKEALTVAPTWSPAHVGLATIHERGKRYPEAIKEYETALRYGSGDITVLTALCMNYKLAQLPEQADQCWGWVRAQDPSNAVARSMASYTAKDLAQVLQ